MTRKKPGCRKGARELDYVGDVELRLKCILATLPTAPPGITKGEIVARWPGPLGIPASRTMKRDLETGLARGMWSRTGIPLDNAHPCR